MNSVQKYPHINSIDAFFGLCESSTTIMKRIAMFKRGNQHLDHLHLHLHYYYHHHRRKDPDANRRSFELFSMIILLLMLGTIIDNTPRAQSLNIDRNDRLASECPQYCHCSLINDRNNNGEKLNSVQCDAMQLKLIPTLPIWTEYFDMSNNPLVTLDRHSTLSSIPTPDNLVEIDLSHTLLQYVDPMVLSYLFDDGQYVGRTIQRIRFDHNDLAMIPVISSLIEIRSLSLNNNRLVFESIIDLNLFEFYPNLEYLDLSSNFLERIPAHFLVSINQNQSPTPKDYGASLNTLILSNNKIKSIDSDAFKAFPNIRVLKLAKNQLKTISKSWLSPLINLRELDLNNNQIDKIDILAFGSLKSLQILKMRRNHLQGNLSDGTFWGLERLEKLYLDHNQVSQIREGWIYGLDSLRELSLKHNSIEFIKENAWNSVRNLQELNLQSNSLKTIQRKTFDKLANLQSLKLSSNNISFIDEQSFRFLNKLEFLDLSSNQLSWTIEGSNGLFNGLNSLKELRLNQNHIRLIYNHTFNGLKRLESLNLSSNPISSIQRDAFKWFDNLEDLSLNHIELHCDCTLKWFSTWLRSNPLRSRLATNIHCAHPKELVAKTSRSFLDLDLNEMKCQNFLKPYLIEDSDSNKSISAIKNQETSFRCRVTSSTSNDSLVFKWFKDNQIIEGNNRVRFETVSEPYTENVTLFTNTLTLKKVEDYDQGRYHCMASNDYGSVYSQKSLVTVVMLPYFTKRPRNVTVKIGHTAKLECAAKGQPAPTISWRKDGDDNFLAAMERRMHVMPSDDVFFIVEVKKSDMGSYSCHAVNNAGSVVSTTILNVIEMPSFVRKMTDKTATIGSTVSLECMTAGIPMPDIVWHKDGELLQPTERHFFTAEGQLLIIVKLKSSDQGTYSCNISNAYGHAFDSSYLSVVTTLAANEFDKSGSHNPLALNSFFLVVRHHAFIVIIIVCCIGFTSFAWIVVICYIRQRHRSYLKETLRSPVDPGSLQRTLSSSSSLTNSDQNFDWSTKEYLLDRHSFRRGKKFSSDENDSVLNSGLSSEQVKHDFIINLQIS